MNTWWRNLSKQVHLHITPTGRNDHHPHLLRGPFIAFFLAIIILTETFFVTNLLARSQSSNFLAAVFPASITTFTNAQRSGLRAPALTENALLAKAAQAKAEDMALRGYFSHNTPDGKRPWVWLDEVGYNYQYAGENLAVRFVDSSEVVNAWMRSPSHRANIVNPSYREVGVGVADGLYRGQPATYVVQFFGTKRNSIGDVSASVSLSSVGQYIADIPLRSLRYVEAEPLRVAGMLLSLVVIVFGFAICIHIIRHPGRPPFGTFFLGLMVALAALVCMFANARLIAETTEVDQRAASVVR